MLKLTLTVLAVLMIGLGITVLDSSKVEAAPPHDADRAMELLEDLAAAPDPDAALMALSAEELDLLRWATTPTGEEGSREYTEEGGGGAFGGSDDIPICNRHVREKYRTSPLGIQYLTYQSATWWCRHDGEIYGSPSHSAWGRVHVLYKITWKFGGNDYKSNGTSHNNTRHNDVAQGHFNNCLPPAPGLLPICIRGWTVRINKVQYAETGQETSW